MKYPKLLIVVVCLSLLPIRAFAQEPAEKKLDKKIEQKALALLDELIEETSSFKLPENRARILTLAADMLWQHDEKRARALFGEAMSLLARAIRQPEDSPEAIPENFYWQLFQVRQEAVQLIAGRDVQLALDFLAATRPAENKALTYTPENEAQIEMMLAHLIARRDPKKALQTAKGKLAAEKHPNSVLSLLGELSRKDQAAAQELADAIVAKLRANSPLDYESAVAAIGLLAYAPPPSANAEADESGIKPLISPATAREMIEKAAATAAAAMAAARKQNDSEQRGYAVNLLQQLKSMMSHIEKYAPASVAALKRGLAESEQMMDANQRRWNELNALAEKGSPEMLIEAAAKASPEMKSSYFQRAAQIAREKGGTDNARQLINQHFPEGPQRQQALRDLNQQTMWQRINEGKFDEARQLAAALRSPIERANLLMQMASIALNTDKKEDANQLLAEAWNLVEGPAESNPQLNTQLQIAGGYVRLNPSRSFEILEATIDRFNELFAAGALLENFDQQGSFRNNEMLMTGSGSGRAYQYLWHYVQHLGELSRTDLERVQTLIGRFARVEVRTQLRLGVLHRCLRGGGEVIEQGGIGIGMGYSRGGFSRIH
ncbi:MAG TPA: hypothetical protein PKA34_08785 [Blastocatellia bacterium]|nr:hypothetical protein [Blastocatellia bacterium]